MLVFSWGWIGLVVAAMAAGFVGGCEHKQRQLDAYVAAGEAQNRQTAQTIQKHKQIAQDVKNDYESRIAAIRSSYRVRSPGTGLMPPATSTTCGIDATTAYNALAESCAETTQQLISLQDFIKETR